MDADIEGATSVVNHEALRSRLEMELRTHVPDEALAAMAHSLDAVCTQLIRAAFHGLKEEVEQQIEEGTFQGIPDLHARHFLRTYQ